ALGRVFGEKQSSRGRGRTKYRPERVPTGFGTGLQYPCEFGKKQEKLLDVEKQLARIHQMRKVERTQPLSLYGLFSVPASLVEPPVLSARFFFRISHRPVQD